MGYYYGLATALLEALYHGLYMIDCEGANMHDVIKRINGLQGESRKFGVAALTVSGPDYAENERTFRGVLQEIDDRAGDDKSALMDRLAARQRVEATVFPGHVPARAWILGAVRVIRENLGSHAVESQHGVIRRRYERNAKIAWAASAKRAEAGDAAIDAMAS